MKTGHLAWILGGNVRIAKKHEVIYIIACVEKQTTYCRVCNLIRYKRYRPQVEIHQFLDILHLLVERHLEPLENLRDPLCPKHFMSMECPSERRIISLGRRFGNIVKKSRPSEPHVRFRTDLHSLHAIFKHIILQKSGLDSLGLKLGDIVENLKSVGEILFMTLSLNRLDSLQF